MGSFLNNRQAYNIKAENEISVILSNFSTEYVFGIMEDSIKRVFTEFDPIPKPNIVNAFETNFKAIMGDYPEDKEQVIDVRDETYKEIISYIANGFKFVFTTVNDIDPYSSAKYLYDFFVANFDNYLISFLAEYIIKEQNAIYTALGLEKYRRDKDVTTLYNKKVYENLTIAIICSHLDVVLKQISVYDINLQYILNIIYKNNIQIMSIFNNVDMENDFFHNVYMRILFDPRLYAIISTYLRINVELLLQIVL